MNAPYSKHKKSTPRQLLADEARLCFAVAAACLLIGLSGWLINRIAALHTPLSALVVVGLFYGLMGLARLWKRSRTRDRDNTMSGNATPEIPNH